MFSKWSWQAAHFIEVERNTCPTLAAVCRVTVWSSLRTYSMRYFVPQILGHGRVSAGHGRIEQASATSTSYGLLTKLSRIHCR